MAQEDKNVTIPPEMMQEIVRVASETAIEKFQHEAERNRKAVKDKRLHNTKLLLQNYHCFVEHMLIIWPSGRMQHGSAVSVRSGRRASHGSGKCRTA